MCDSVSSWVASASSHQSQCAGSEPHCSMPRQSRISCDTRGGLLAQQIEQGKERYATHIAQKRPIDDRDSKCNQCNQCNQTRERVDLEPRCSSQPGGGILRVIEPSTESDNHEHGRPNDVAGKTRATED